VVRLTSGKLTRYVANDATDPFDLADWTPTNATESLSSGDLECTIGVATAFGFLRHDAQAERGKIMVHALVTRVGSENNHGVVAAHLVDNSNFSYAGKRFNGATAATRAVTLVERVANSVVASASQDGVLDVANLTYTKLAVFRDGATTLEGYGFDDDLRNTLTADLVETEGNQTSAGQSVRAREYYEATDKVVTCSGLAAGNKIKVLDADDVVLGEGTESGGVASADILEAWPSEAVVVVVTSSADEELARFDAIVDDPANPLVWGGDTYEASSDASAIPKTYRYRIADAGASAVEGNVAYTFDTEIADVGPVGGQRVYPKRSGTSSRPWSIEIADVDEAVTAILAGGDGRAQLLRRLADISVSTDGGSFYTVLATARIDDVEMVDVAAFRLTHQDERLIERTTTIFKGSNTTRIAPAGLNAAWLDFQPPAPARYVVAETGAAPDYTIYDITVSDDRLLNDVIGEPARPSVAALELMEADVVDDPAPDQGNFTHLRASIDGTDREVEAFNGGAGPSPLRYLVGEGNQSRRIRRFRVSGYQDAGGVGAVVEVFFHMLTHDPTPELRLHIGGQNGVDPFTLVKDIYDGTYQDSGDPQTVRYETAAFTAYDPSTNPDGLIDNPRFPKMHFDPDGPANMGEWLDENIYGPLGVTPFVNADGEIAPRYSRQPATDQVADPDALFEFTAANLSLPHPGWHNQGREQVTVVETEFHYTRAAQASDEPRDLKRLDGLVDATAQVTREHDNVSTAGRMVHTVKVRGVHRIADRAMFARQLSAELFERFGDGPILSGGSGNSTTETVVAGDWCILDLDSYPALQNQSRSGKRLVQIMSRVDTPAGPEFEFLEAGPNSQPLGALTVTLAANANDDHNAIDATIGALPAGADGYELHVAVNASEPAEGSPLWQYRTIRGTQAETVTIRRVPSGSTVWVRPRPTGVGRITGDWGTADSQATTALTAPSGVADSDVAGDVATVSWTNGEADFDLVLDLDGTERVRLANGTTSYKLRGLTLSTAYTAGVKHIDGYGGESARATDGFTTTGTAEAVPKPEGLRILVGA
jgi:hypothetical protein